MADQTITAELVHLDRSYAGRGIVCGITGSVLFSGRLVDATCPRCNHDDASGPRTRALKVEKAHAEALVQDAARPAEQPELIYSAKGKPAICSICCAQVGELHEDYCHGSGAVIEDPARRDEDCACLPTAPARSDFDWSRTTAKPAGRVEIEKRLWIERFVVALRGPVWTIWAYVAGFALISAGFPVPGLLGAALSVGGMLLVCVGWFRAVRRERERWAGGGMLLVWAASTIPQPPTRVEHDNYGTGTVLQADGPWLLIKFDGQSCPAVGIHAEDVTPAAHVEDAR